VTVVTTKALVPLHATENLPLFCAIRSQIDAILRVIQQCALLVFGITLVFPKLESSVLLTVFTLGRLTRRTCPVRERRQAVPATILIRRINTPLPATLCRTTKNPKLTTTGSITLDILWPGLLPVSGAIVFFRQRCQRIHTRATRTVDISIGRIASAAIFNASRANPILTLLNSTKPTWIPN